MQRSPEVNHYGLSIVENGDENPTRRLYAVGKGKTRLLVQKGLEYVLLRLKDIVLFYTENKVTYVVDNSEKKYISPYNLTELERELDYTSFFVPTGNISSIWISSGASGPMKK